MKKTTLLILLTSAVFGCVWLLRNSDMPSSPDIALPTTRHHAPIIPAKADESSRSEPKPGTWVPLALDQAWITARSASIEINQSLDPVIGEPVGSIRLGGVSIALGETPPFYRLQLRTARHPILIGDKDTRHHFIRRVDSVQPWGGSLALQHQINVSYPRSASFGGFVFKQDHAEISQIGIIVPDVKVPAGDDPSATRWATSIRIGNHELSGEDLARAVSQPLGTDTVLVMPTHTGSSPATARVLWLALNANGSFALSNN